MKNYRIPFNIPFRAAAEKSYIELTLESGRMAGNGPETQLVQSMLEQRYGFRRCFLTNSCTAALEMSALLADIQPGDEVIMPSYGFVTTATAFALRGAQLKFCDSMPSHPNVGLEEIKRQITERTKALVIIHYGGVACNIAAIQKLCDKNGILLIEDAAQSIDAYYNELPLGSFGDLATFSFHETKNINTGQGGMLVVNNPALVERAAVIWDKGTNREAFLSGQADHYEWTDLGSSFLPSEIMPAILKAQLQELSKVQRHRRKLWDIYYESLSKLDSIRLFTIPDGANPNAHLFPILCESKTQRDDLIAQLKEHGIEANFHYQPLHLSAYHRKANPKIKLENAERFADQLLRLPLYHAMTEDQVKYVCKQIKEFDTGQ